MRLRTQERAGRTVRRAGFTLMELLVVVAILLVLVSVATPMYMSYLDKSKLGIARTDCIRLAGELKNFSVVNSGDYPEPMGSWELLPLEKIPPLDPWNMPYQWALSEAPLADGTVLLLPIVMSTGPDRTSGTADDILSNQ